MRNIWNGIVCLALCLFMSTGLMAQVRDNNDKDKDKDKYNTGASKDNDDKNRNNDSRENREMNKRLSQDVYSRNPATKDAIIVWDNTDEGYDGTYAIGDVKYMARYDKQGKYVETLTERKWDDNAPANIRSSFEKSDYKSNKVRHFWEVNEPGRKGYYLELKDDNGKSRRIWSDENGKFSEGNRKREY